MLPLTHIVDIFCLEETVVAFWEEQFWIFPVFVMQDSWTRICQISNAAISMNFIGLKTAYAA